MRLEGFQSQSEFVRQAEGQAKSCLERIEKAEKKSMGTQGGQWNGAPKRSPTCVAGL